MANLAIIPARGGSKRIPGKNIKNFCGSPIISYSIQTALTSGLFDEVMVSTDDAAIADVAKSYGAKIPFMRSAKNADDYATTFDVIEEVIESYQKKGHSFQYICCIYATAPFITTALLKDAFQKLNDNNYDSVFPVIKYSHPIWRSLKMEDEKTLMWWPENLNKRSQDLPDSYHDAGQFYWLDVAAALKNEKLFTGNSAAIVLDELHVQDIDTVQDWQLAELKYKLLQEIA